MYSRVITPRSSTQRTQTRPQTALRPMNPQNQSGRVLGNVSREEARRLQKLKYEEDHQRFVEKEKKKAEKKREEKWKRYGHIDVGQRLNSSEGGLEAEVESIRERQQFMYDAQGSEGLELERQREAARISREERRRVEKLKRYNIISPGRSLSGVYGSEPDHSRYLGNESSRRQLAVPEGQSTEKFEGEHEKQFARSTREQEKREEKLKKCEHLNLGRRLSNDSAISSPGCSTSVGRLQQSSYDYRNIAELERQANYNRAIEEKTKHYQGKKLPIEDSLQNIACTAASSSPKMSNLNMPIESKSEDASNLTQVERDEQNREQMKLARERLQQKYNEVLHKTS